MKKYNLQRASKNIITRFRNAYREDLEKIGVTQRDIDEKGVPDLDKTKPPKGNWSDGYVTETGISYLEDALREYYDKPIQIKEDTPKPIRKKKKPKQRGAFRTFIEPAGAPEEIVSIFKAIASLPQKEKEEVGEAVSEVVIPEIKKPKKRGGFRSTKVKAGIGEDLSSLFKAAAIAYKSEPQSSTPEVKSTKEILSQKPETNLPKLPKELAGARCNYRDAVLYFSNDIDKAAYIISSKGRKKDSRRHADYVKWAEKATGWPLSKIVVLGLEIKFQLKDLYAQAQQEGDFFINVPDIYSKFKTEFDEISEDEIETEEEPAAEEKPKYDFPGYSYSQFLEKYDKKPEKKKRKSRETVELTKRQEEILHKILEDLIQIRHKLVEIKKNQDDKIAYERKRDRLQAERLSFIERERQIEALPDSQSESSKESKSSRENSERKGNPWYKDIVQNSLISGIASFLLGGKKDDSSAPPNQQTPPLAPSPNKPTTPGGNPQSPPSNTFNISQYAKPLMKAVPIPGMSVIPFAEGGVVGPSSMLPFADGGTIQPVGSSSTGTSIQPLDAVTNQTNGGGTTYSKGFSMGDLKSPLAEVMKLPLKVAGAALLSAISRLTKQFDITDQKLQSDLSKMVGDISKAFGLQKPSISEANGATDSESPSPSGNDEQTNLIAAINNVANSLVGTEDTNSSNSDTGNNNTQSAPSTSTSSASSASGTNVPGASTSSSASGTNVPGASTSSSASGTNVPGAPASAGTNTSSNNSNPTQDTKGESNQKISAGLNMPSSSSLSVSLASMIPNQGSKLNSNSGMSSFSMPSSNYSKPNANLSLQTTIASSLGMNADNTTAKTPQSRDALWGDDTKTDKSNSGNIIAPATQNQKLNDNSGALWGDDSRRVQPTKNNTIDQEPPRYLPLPRKPEDVGVYDTMMKNPEWEEWNRRKTKNNGNLLSYNPSSYLNVSPSNNNTNNILASFLLQQNPSANRDAIFNPTPPSKQITLPPKVINNSNINTQQSEMVARTGKPPSGLAAQNLYTAVIV